MSPIYKSGVYIFRSAGKERDIAVSKIGRIKKMIRIGDAVAQKKILLHIIPPLVIILVRAVCQQGIQI